MQKALRIPASRLSWLWALLPLLLAAALVAPILGRDVFDIDESSTMINAGARHLGPFTPAEAVHTSVSRSPDQAWGNGVVVSQWGRVAGWSELAIRALPWLTGMLSLAWVYRLGHTLFSHRIALTTMLLLSTSVIFLTYMHKARPYGLAMLFAAIVLWAYWRVALHPRPPGRGARALLVLGATGLLYTNYFCALLLPALALFHLFFVRKERCWWQPVLLLGLAALLALPQVPDLLSGIEHNQEKDHLHAEALRYPEVIATFLRYLSNGLFVVQRPFSTLFAIALPLPLLYFVLHSRRSRQPPGAAWYLLLTGILLLLLLLGASEWLRVFEEKRVRYLVMLWLPSLLLISQAFMEPSRVNLRRAAGLALVALVALAGASDFLLEGELVRFSRLRSETAMSIAATRAIAAEGSDSGLLAVDRSGLFARFHRVYEFYTGSYGDRRVQLDQPAASNELMERAPGQDLVWLLASSSQEAALGVRAHLDHFRQEGWFHCRSSREAGVTLELLLPPFPAAMLDQARLHFENDVELFAPVAPELHDGLLRFRSSLGSADETLLARYSLAIHIIEPPGDKRVAQGDTGLGPGAVVPLCREIDISALPPGEYEVRVALYDWQTGERLLARGLETDEVSDMHTLQRFRIG